jgi:ABC-2 type transport system permease protein
LTATTVRPPAAAVRPASFTYTRYEIVRSLRNLKFFAFSLVFPLVLFLLIATPNRHQVLDGVPFPLQYMTGMAAWGTMTAVIAGGARIAMERSLGWNRQLRVTPLSPRTYLQAKVLSGYLVAVFSIVLLYAAGTALGVRLSPGHWFTMTSMILIGLVPFAALGILLGHLLSADAMGPAMGGVTSLLGLVGGAWGPITGDGMVRQLAELVPSYWLVEAGHTAIGGGLWPVKAWLVLGFWTLVLTRLAARAWQRDTQRA